MEEIINNGGIVTKIFAKTIENEALNQITELCNNEAYKNNKIRIMPDVHAGKGCTIGTTIQLIDKVTPNLVGVDINCGILVIELGNIDLDLKYVDEIINKFVPCGFNIHDNPLFDFSDKLSELYCYAVIDKDMANKSIGTLGSGNHFIEIDVDDDNNKYLVIHSGSRNLGVRVCKYYQDLAIKSMSDKSTLVKDTINKLKEEGKFDEIQKALAKIPKTHINKDLAYLEGENYYNYLHDMSIVGLYANLNRKFIAKIILDKLGLSLQDYSFPMFETLHNYININNKILRKGAVSAQLGERLIIPMNMRDGSLICIGKGNADWNYSAPHGAGRLMSRTKAKESIEMVDYKDTMEGIYSTSITPSTIDEAPQAYKPMEEIIECIKDTVEIEKIIKPIYNFKAK